jgi:hypothetical protein
MIAVVMQTQSSGGRTYHRLLGLVYDDEGQNVTCERKIWFLIVQ